MKQFLRDILVKTFKNLASFFLAILVMSVFIGILLAFYGEKPVEVPENAVLYIDIDRVVRDSPAELSPEEKVQRLLRGEGDEPLHLRALRETLEAAARDERIAAVYLESGGATGSLTASFANLRALRDSLQTLKASGKPVYAWFEWAMLREFVLLRSVAELHMEPLGGVLIGGLSTERFYLAEAFEKYGIGVQTAVAGDYKSATESFTRNDMSDFDREQIRLYMTALWEGIAEDLVSDSSLAREALEKAAHTSAWIDGPLAAELGLVDSLEGRPEVFAKLVDLAGSGEIEGEPAWIDLESYAADVLPRNREEQSKSDSSQGVAIVYVEGVIVDGEGSWEDAGARRVSRFLREARFDEDVAAVVLRVNSPGGSVTASEMIRREIELLGEAGKPVVASFGGLAASGGYWISTAAETIVSEPLCLTGSIGVWGMLLNFEELASEQGLHFDRERTHPDSGFLAPTAPLSDKQMEAFQARIDQFYEDFIERVAEARKMTKEEVLAIAGGHVWSGRQALEHGLVDQLGTLDDALAMAARKANLPEDFIVFENPESTFGEPLWQSLLQSAISITGPLLPRESLLQTRLTEPLREAAKLIESPLHIRAQLPYELHLNQ
jgi:protease IV